MKKILMPEALTAENGAKAALIGEFFETVKTYCPDCLNNELDYNCEMCGGDGFIDQKVQVSWTTIKEIYKRAVEILHEDIPCCDTPGSEKCAQCQEVCQ